jgi:hypothetical protein
MLRSTDEDSTAQCAEHRAIFTLTKGHTDAHEYVVSAVAWYPIDSGLFISGSVDKEVKVRFLGWSAIHVWQTLLSVLDVQTALGPGSAFSALLNLGLAQTPVSSFLTSSFIPGLGRKPPGSSMPFCAPMARSCC